MNTVSYILIAVIVICFLLIIHVSIYNHYQTYIIRINEAETFIETTLRKRYDLLNKSIGIIKSNIDTKDEDIIKTIKEIRSSKLKNFELDRKLYDAINEFNQYKEKYPNLRNSESFLKIELELFESESEIVAARKYYNDIITDYNLLVKKFPTNIIGKINRYKVKEYFNGNDEDKEEIKI